MGASAQVTVAFVVLGIVVLGVLFGILRKSPAKRWLAAYSIFLLAIAPYAFFVLDADTFFTAMPIVGISFVMAIVGGFGGAGKWLAQYPLWVLIGIQTFRLPLEIILHRLYAEGVMPEQMTWSGSNFDVVTGVIAPVFAVLTIVAGKSRPRIQAGLAIVFSVVGLALLANVGRLAATSLPHGFTEYSRDAPLLLVYSLPFSYIVPVFVFAALFFHIALIRSIRNLQTH